MAKPQRKPSGRLFALPLRVVATMGVMGRVEAGLTSVCAETLYDDHARPCGR